MLLVISLCQSEGFRVKQKATNLEQMAEAQFTTLEHSSTNEGGMHEQARGKSVTSRPTPDTRIFGADENDWEVGWKKGWEGCPVGWATITHPLDCKNAAIYNAEEYGIQMEESDWEEENGFTAGSGLAWWPQGCVVNKKTNKVKFNNHNRGVGESLALKYAKEFKVICKKGLKHAYFDFDQTITRIHVWKNLYALGASVETGQVHKLEDLDKSTWKYDEKSSKVVEDMRPNGKPWSIAAMGGTDRIEKDIRPYLSVLKEAGVKLTVITKGNVGVARYILNQASLMDFFETVYGNIGNNYGPATEYDLSHTDLTRYEGEEDVNLGKWRSKLSLISELMKNNEATFSEAVLVEDDITEANSVSSQCEAVYISERKGTEAVHLKQIIALAGIVTPQTPLSIQTTRLL
jgi:phosphoglycolate phosphatase-like HAD superfamily hydrolase